MSLPEVQLNTVKLVITLTVTDKSGNPIDISAATVKNILLKDSLITKTVYPKVASFVTNGTDGKIRYTTQSGDLNSIGVWEVQGEIDSPNFTGRTSVERFKVVRNIEC